VDDDNRADGAEIEAHFNFHHPIENAQGKNGKHTACELAQANANY